MSISADGSKIAYSLRPLTSDIWTVPVSLATGEGTGSAVPLMEDRSVRKTNPAISPDGSKIGIGVWRSGGPPLVWLIDADGKNPGPLSTSGVGSTLPGWLSNDEISYQTLRQGAPNTIEAKNLKSGVERVLFTPTPDMDFYRLSPDGNQIAFNSNKGGTINIWKSQIAGGPAIQLTFDKELMGWPTWSPDGRFLAFEMKRGDDTQLAIMPAQGGEIKQLTFDHGQSWPHSWSPDGSMVTFAGLRNGVWNIFTVSARDGVQKQLTEFDKFNTYVRYPAWSPRGNQIVFEKAVMTGNIWVMELK